MPRPLQCIYSCVARRLVHITVRETGTRTDRTGALSTLILLKAQNSLRYQSKIKENNIQHSSDREPGKHVPENYGIKRFLFHTLISLRIPGIVKVTETN